MSKWSFLRHFWLQIHKRRYDFAINRKRILTMSRTQGDKSSIFVAWEQVLDASEWSEHSTRRDESHKYA